MSVWKTDRSKNCVVQFFYCINSNVFRSSFIYYISYMWRHQIRKTSMWLKNKELILSFNGVMKALFLSMKFISTYKLP